MSSAALVWLVCFVVAGFTVFFARSTLRAFVLASFASFVVVYASALCFGHPVEGFSLASIGVAAVVAAATASALRVVLHRAKIRRHG